MASLREIKGRIASVGSTLKITSAMKLVASAKLRKAQQAIGNMLPYENHLHRILLDLMSSGLSLADRQSGSGRVHPRSAAAEYGLSQAAESSASSALLVTRPVGKVAIVAFSSNSSLCGAFNANAIRETLSVINEYRAAGLQDGDITVYSIGRKMQEAMNIPLEHQPMQEVELLADRFNLTENEQGDIFRQMQLFRCQLHADVQV